MLLTLDSAEAAVGGGLLAPVLGLFDKESAAFPALVMDEARRLRRGSGTGGSDSSPLEEEDSSGFIFGAPSGSYERIQAVRNGMGDMYQVPWAAGGYVRGWREKQKVFLL